MQFIRSDGACAKRAEAALKLRSLILSSDHQHEARRSFDELIKTLTLCLADKHGEVVDAAARALGCLGAIARQTTARFFDHIFDIASSPSPPVSMRTGVLKALFEMVSVAEVFSLTPFVPSILERCRHVLEVADIPDVLPPMMHIFRLISQRYPSLFIAQFPDVVDVIIGWRLDTAVPSNVHIGISEFITGLHDTWSSCRAFADELLSKLASDLTEIASTSTPNGAHSVAAFARLLSIAIFHNMH